MGNYWKGWLLAEEFKKFEELCPWPIDILERWVHDDPNMYGGMEAIGFEVYAEEGEKAVDKFFVYFDALVDGHSSQVIRAREKKWKKLMLAAAGSRVSGAPRRIVSS